MKEDSLMESKGLLLVEFTAAPAKLAAAAHWGVAVSLGIRTGSEDGTDCEAGVDDSGNKEGSIGSSKESSIGRGEEDSINRGKEGSINRGISSRPVW